MVKFMQEKMQNIIGVIILIFIVIIIVLFWLFSSGNSSDIVDDRIILTPLEVTADPAAYINGEIKVEGVIIDRNQGDSSFVMMPIDIFLSCDRNAYCGEEYTHLNVRYEKTIPPIEHDVIVTGTINKTEDSTYVLVATKIMDKGLI